MVVPALQTHLHEISNMYSQDKNFFQPIVQYQTENEVLKIIYAN